MADEISVTFSLTVTNGTFKDSFAPGQLKIDQTTQGSNSGVLSIGTTAETVAFTDITSEGLFLVQNLDASNFILLGPDSTGMVDFLKIKPGEFQFLRLKPAVTVKAKADTAACKLFYILLDD